MKCCICGVTGFSRDELVDYRGDGKLYCGQCADDQDIMDKNEDWETDEFPLEDDQDEETDTE